MTSDMQLPLGQEKFAFEHALVHKFGQMEELISRHNQMVAAVPKIIDETNAATVHVLMAEIDKNMNVVLAMMTELERDCEKSEFFRRDNVSARQP